MISTKILEDEKKVYIDVSGYISSADAKKFLMEYKQMTKPLKSSQYKLIVTPSVFQCENEEDIKAICMAFYKTNYRKIYLVDPNNYILSSFNLKPLEKKMFLKAVKVISKSEDAI